MAEILFYHLTESRVETVIPGLLERTLERGWKAVVQCGGEAMRDHLDNHLWTYRDDSFLPHAASGDPQGNPIWLTTASDNPVGATVRFLIDGAEPPPMDGYERVIFMFDGFDENAVAAARSHWKAMKDGGHDLTYWQQDGGRWTKKA